MTMSTLLYFCLFLLCAVITLVYIVCLCRVWSAVARQAAAEAEAEAAREAEAEAGEAEADKSNDGLTAEQLEKLEEGTMAVGGGGECAVCLEEIAEGQAARVLPVCGHAFHRQCADDWLQHHATCPICRAHPLPPSQPQP